MADFKALNIDQGGTNATTASTARTNLGVAYGTTAGTVLEGSKDALYAKLASANVFTGANRTTNTNPRYIFEETDAPTDEKFWFFDVQAGQFRLRGANDSFSAGFDYLTVNRNGTSVDSWDFKQGEVYFNGNVGIGTTSPASIAHIYQNNAEVGGGAGLTIEQDGTGDVALQLLRTGVRRWKIGHHNTDSSLAFTSGGLTSPQMIIQPGGNVGIGTTSPGSKLHLSDVGNCELRISADSDNSGANEKAILRFDVDGGADQWTIEMDNLEGPASALDFVDDAGAKRMILKRNTINAGTLPTSATGLSSGDIWRDGTTLKIVA